jgi:hypothetical protein
VGHEKEIEVDGESVFKLVLIILKAPRIFEFGGLFLEQEGMTVRETFAIS